MGVKFAQFSFVFGDINDLGSKNINDLGSKNEKRKMKLVGNYVKELLHQDQLSLQDFNLVFALFEDFLEGQLTHFGDHRRLLHWYGRLLAANAPMNKATRMTLQIKEGKVLEVLRDYAHAITAYRKGLDSCTTRNEFANCYNLLGMAYRFHGEKNNAIKMFQKSLKNVDDKVVHQNLREAMNEQGHEKYRKVDYLKQENTDYLCTYCSKSGPTKICAGCKCVRYCDRVCQKMDWIHHKEDCKRARSTGKFEVTIRC